MVGPLKYFSHDPNGKGRGSGYYYHRGNGYYSKWRRLKDQRHKGKVGKKGRKRWWRKGKIGSGKYKHTHDFKKRKKKR
ncbi:MAG: hypothetical protein ACTSX6_10410 [Candidatus Heimdallarchaeaceae archaeon]